MSFKGGFWWAWVVNGLLVVGLVMIIVWYGWKENQNQVEVTQNQQVATRLSAGKLILEERLRQMMQKTKTQLQDSREVPYQLIADYAQTSGLQVCKITVRETRATRAILLVAIELAGDYPAAIRFFEQLRQSEFYSKLNQVELMSNFQSNSTLKLSLLLSFPTAQGGK